MPQQVKQIGITTPCTRRTKDRKGRGAHRNQALSQAGESIVTYITRQRNWVPPSAAAADRR